MVDVRIHALRKTFPDGTVAVHDLDLDIPDREFLTLLGPSGCGKTTTLRMIAGLESPTSGDILFGGQRVNEVPPGARNIAMVFQSYALYSHMTVAENLEYPSRKRGVAKDERAARIRGVAATLRLEPLLKRRPKELSGGQQQRVALGRAIVRDPQVFLLDEPLSNLDAALRGHMRAELIQLHRRLQATMIYVTHDQMEAMTMSTRIAILHEGRLRQLGTPDEVYNAPADRFVASFVGTPAMNFFEGELTSEDRRIIFRNREITVPLATETIAGASGNVVLGVRPEDVLIGEGPMTGEATVVEPTGRETLLSLTLGGQEIVACTGPETKVRPLERVPLSFRTARLHLFDAVSGKRLNGRVG